MLPFLYLLAILLGALLVAVISMFGVPMVGGALLGSAVALAGIAAVDDQVPALVFAGAGQPETAQPLEAAGFTKTPTGAWYRPYLGSTAENERAGDHIVLLHGNDANASSVVAMLGVVTETPWAITIVEYPGFGAQPGPATLDNARAAVRAQAREAFARSSSHLSRRVLAGFSLGGALAWDAVDALRPHALLTLCTFTSFAAIHYGAELLAPEPYASWDLHVSAKTWQGKWLKVVIADDEYGFNGVHVQHALKWAALKPGRELRVITLPAGIGGHALAPLNDTTWTEHISWLLEPSVSS